MGAVNQQQWRTLTGVDTIPSSANNQIAGTVTTDTTNDDHLVYTGAVVLNDSNLMNPVLYGFEGLMWVFVPAATVKLAKVLGVTNTGTNTWVIQLDRSMAGVAGADLYYVISDLKSFSCANQGSASGTFEGQALLKGSVINEKIFYNYKTNTVDAVWVDASGTSYLIEEDR